MKTHTIKTPTAELMIVELQEGLTQMRKNTLSVMQHDGWKILGKPDEIREEDARELVEETEMSVKLNSKKYKYRAYNSQLGFPTAKESLLSLLETEIYWENPLSKDEPKCIRYGTSPERIKNLEWREAEQNTFDRNRSLIFKKKI